MKIFSLISLFLFFVESASAKDIEKLVWPSFPDEARIEYITSASKAEDFGIEKGFFSSVIDFILGDDDTVISTPFGIHADKTKVYVTDVSSKSLFIFDKEENEMKIINGSKNEKFLYPIDVALDSKGNIFVSDSVRAKIYVFEKDGDFSHTIKNKVFQRPVGIAISPEDKKLYIVDALASQIHVTSLKGKFLYSIGKKGTGNGEFNRPTFIDVGHNGRLYVSDSMNHRVQILDENGAFIHKFGRLGQNIGSFGSPRGISLDKDNNIYVIDSMYNNIQIFNQNGELLMVLGGYGNRAGKFALPEDIHIANNNIYVTDSNNRRIQIFTLLNPAQKRSLK